MTDANTGDHRPDEQPFMMSLEPAKEVVFRGDDLDVRPRTEHVTLTNTTKCRQAFKVKCSSNEIFRVKPAIGFIRPGKTRNIQLTFFSVFVPCDNVHFFSFYHLPADETDIKPRKLFYMYKAAGVKRIPIRFEKENGKPFTTDNGKTGHKKTKKDDKSNKEEKAENESPMK
ncbi:hypothetical protein AB6A40_003635 [Gnathostoma spinigerum]|uniref:Major sperm protein n=1 Tax=Gnathostoma spinigerum TaxID=75299 RepID=A0ABD6EBA8_9BILA